MSTKNTWLTNLRDTFEIQRGGNENLRPMEGLRGFAVTLVFFVHYAVLFQGWLPADSVALALTRRLHDIGHAGVDLFFLLSGFLIYGSLVERPRPFGTYLARRLERIYPTFLAVLAMYLALSFLLPSESKLPAEPGRAALYILQNLLLLPGVFNIQPIISVTWSLSFEMLFYLAVPLLIAGVGLRAWDRPRRIALFLALAAAGVVTFAFVIQSGEYIRLVMFLAGMILHEALRLGWFGVRLPGAGLPALATGLFLLPSLPLNPSTSALRILLLFTSLIWLCADCFSNPNGLGGSAFSWTPLRWLGNMSYSYFLMHGLALQAIALVLNRLSPVQADQAAIFWIGLPVFFVLSLFPAALLYLLVERPYSLLPARKSTRLATPTS